MSDTGIILLNALPKEEFSSLYQMLKNITIPFRSKNSNNSRRGFEKHRATVFGKVRQRFTGKIDLSAFTKKHPAIYAELKRIGNTINPNYEFSSVYVNHNVTCPKHVDSNNVGKSILVSFGDYTGSNIVINDVKYNAYLQPILFNGALLEHYNTPDLNGDKYSLVFFYNKEYV
jgi:hypothetical protein